MGKGYRDVLDVLVGIFYFLNLKKIRIISKTAVFHGVIYNMSTRKEYRRFFKDLFWQERTFGLFAPNLDSYLWCMYAANLIYNSSSDDVFVVHLKLSTTWRQHCQPLFDENELELIKSLAEDIATEFAKAEAEAA